jgi:lipopolysaccharide export system protein LptA
MNRQRPDCFDLSLFILLGLLLLGLLLSAQSYALPEDREKPINLEADSASFDQNTGVSIYQGNVVVTQGTMYLAADKATVYLQGGEFQKMEAVGKPTQFRYQPTGMSVGLPKPMLRPATNAALIL